MCLHKTKRTLRYKNGKVVLYKALQKRTKYEPTLDQWIKILESPYHALKYHPGWNIASGAKPLKEQQLIGNGVIHVCTSKKAALEHTHIAVPVTCYKKDFVACGKSKDAAFTKIFIKKADYERALK